MNKPTRAFTLIEVVLALGVVSTALISLLGLTAVAMNLLRESIQTTTQSQIIQSIASEVLMIDSSKVSSHIDNSSVRYFDDEGQPWQAGRPRVYKAELDLEPAGVPGGDAKAGDAQRIIIKISSAATGGRNSVQHPPKTFSVWAVNNGR